MSAVEKWNEFTRVGDPIIAFGLTLIGIGFLAAHKRLAASRERRVASGELSSEEAVKNAKLTRVCAWSLTGVGLILVVTWILRV